MSSLICNVTLMTCIFARVDTDGPAIYYPSYPTYSPRPTEPPFPTNATSAPLPGNETAWPTPVNETASPTPTPANSTTEEPPGNSTRNEDDLNRKLRNRQDRLLQQQQPDEYYEGEEDEPYFPPMPPFEEDTTMAPWTDVANQDQLSPTVNITRDFRRGIFNAYDDPFAQWDGPSGTEWALLPPNTTFMEARCSLRFSSWRRIGVQPPQMIGKPAVVHLINEDVYYNITFLSWTRGREDDRREENDMGGGFSYVRDMMPMSLPDDLEECPVCDNASPDKSVLTPRDETMEEVRITGVTPTTAQIEIVAISQHSNPACNTQRGTVAGTVQPNAEGVGNSVAMLRKTGISGSIQPFRYTLHFRATTPAGFCRGRVEVCVPMDGFSCDDDYWPHFDATSETYCETQFLRY